MVIGTIRTRTRTRMVVGLRIGVGARPLRLRSWRTPSQCIFNSTVVAVVRYAM